MTSSVVADREKCVFGNYYQLPAQREVKEAVEGVLEGWQVPAMRCLDIGWVVAELALNADWYGHDDRIHVRVMMDKKRRILLVVSARSHSNYSSAIDRKLRDLRSGKTSLTSKQDETDKDALLLRTEESGRGLAIAFQRSRGKIRRNGKKLILLFKE